MYCPDNCLAKAAVGRRSSQKSVQQSLGSRSGSYRRKLSSTNLPAAISGPPSAPQAANHPVSSSSSQPSCFEAAASQPEEPARSRSASPGLQQGRGAFALQTSIVGRRFRATDAVSQGQEVRVQHDALNPRDANALVVVTADTEATLGYLPAAVAAALGPLVRRQLVTTQASIQGLGRTPSAPVPVALQVVIQDAIACMVDHAAQLKAPCMQASG